MKHTIILAPPHWTGTTRGKPAITTALASKEVYISEKNVQPPIGQSGRLLLFGDRWWGR